MSTFGSLSILRKALQIGSCEPEGVVKTAPHLRLVWNRDDSTLPAFYLRGLWYTFDPPVWVSTAMPQITLPGGQSPVAVPGMFSRGQYVRRERSALLFAGHLPKGGMTLYHFPLFVDKKGIVSGRNVSIKIERA